MILPGKHIRDDRALISVGADILSVLQKHASVSQLWEDVGRYRSARTRQSPLPFDWFVLALTLLYAMRAVEWDDDGVRRRTN